MKAILLPLALLALGSGTGIGVGKFLAPAEPTEPPSEAELPDTVGPCGDITHTPAAEVAGHEDSSGGQAEEEREYVRLNNQFVVPVVEGGQVGALVVLSLSVEVDAGTREAVFAHEPKLRDAFLQVLFNHANIGGFAGNFTSISNMNVLRTALRDAAQSTLGPQIRDVLVIDIVRQDVQE
ncbi:flagellar basal body-associated FliL family protein [Roseisalinus antarcticus]|uniref:Flagellar protein FliL n=1 Tax=Roseisalinus antarcticus TaxID=254357 RepID=A0A1Y5TKY0_9RHOB|nr:flagellar basal body-associated FliL family protein [Roseisalinus antarcticus]SLN62766.1 Flagellar basal body-associated protein FliL [Roseisalinus antarcticus]